MDDWQNNQQGHHNLCKKRQMDKDKSLLGTTGIVFVFMGWHLGYAFNFIGYSQLSRKRPPSLHDKVVAYGSWSSSGKLKKIISNWTD